MSNIHDCPREAMRAIGKGSHPLLYLLLQAFLTWLTGKAYPGQKPLFRSSKMFELFKATSALCTGVFASYWILTKVPIWGWPLLIVSWLLTVGAQRRFLVSINHRCVHTQMTGNPRGDRALAEIVSTVLFLQNFDGYVQDHTRLHHHREYGFTFEWDPDAKLLLLLGFHPGLPE
jgi:Fatty acid desaturase